MARAQSGETGAQPQTGDDAILCEVLEACPIGAAILAQVDGRRMFVNSALVTIMGAASRDALLRDSIDNTWVDKSRLSEAWAAFQDKRQLTNFEAERIRLTGERWWVLMNTQPITFNGEAAGIVWHIDITARKQAEKARMVGENRLKEAVEGLSEAFALFDPDDKLVFCNRMFRSLNPELAKIIHPNMTFEDMLRDNLKHGRIIEAIGQEDEFLRKRMAEHIQPSETPSLSQRADGRWLLLQEKRAPDGSTYLVNTDMTDLQNREDALRLEKENAEQANSAKSEFLANMSHEFRTPLNAIIGFSEILTQQLFGEIGDPRYRDYVSDINASGRQLLNLINDILEIAEIEAGRHVLNLISIDFGKIIRTSCDLIRREAQTRNIEFHQSIAANIPTQRADPRALRQILLNVLSNAVQFTPAGGAVCVDAALDSQGGIRISINDTGVGIAEGDIEAILTPFGRLGSETIAHPGRTGLGLPIVKALVEMHNGTIEIQSALGKGTQVNLTFPTPD
jgi:PAS domain S-box-containing protein